MESSHYQRLSRESDCFLGSLKARVERGVFAEDPKDEEEAMEDSQRVRQRKRGKGSEAFGAYRVTHRNNSDDFCRAWCF